MAEIQGLMMVNTVPQRHVFNRGGDEKRYLYSITMYNHV